MPDEHREQQPGRATRQAASGQRAANSSGVACSTPSGQASPVDTWYCWIAIAMDPAVKPIVIPVSSTRIGIRSRSRGQQGDGRAVPAGQQGGADAGEQPGGAAGAKRSGSFI